MHRKDGTVGAWIAGFLAVLIAYSGPLVIFIQAAHKGGMGPDMLSSWIWAISIGAGASGLALSAWLRMPIVTAWSAPGTALLLVQFPHITLSEAVGAYLTAGALTVAIGLSGCFERIVNLIPRGIAAGMMAGILFQFGTGAFRAGMESPAIMLSMLSAYLLGRRFLPRHVVVLVAIVGSAVAFASGETRLATLAWTPAQPSFVAPSFSPGVFFSFTMPLLLVSLTGQYLPGMTVLRLAGYRPPARSIVVGTGLASVVVAGFGGISVVLASITAALCTGRDAHPDADRRYVAGIANGVFYLVGAIFAGSLALVFSAFPPASIASLAGLALIGAIASNIGLLAEDRSSVEPSVIAFLSTASGMTLFGLGAAFWGVAFGMAAHALSRARRPGAAGSPSTPSPRPPGKGGTP